MATANISLSDNGVIVVEGDLDFSTVLHLRRQGEQMIRDSGDDVVVSFSGVTSSGSAAVSLMLCWLRAAKQGGQGICFQCVPDLLRSIIDVSGLSSALSHESK